MHRHPIRRRPLLGAALTGAAWSCLSACSPWAGPRVITLSEAELVDRVDRSFPLARRVLGGLDIELSAPRLRLQPEANRLALALWLRTRERLLGAAGHGRLAFDCALRYDPPQAALRLTQVRVQPFWLAAGPGPATPPALVAPDASVPPGATSLERRLAAALAETVLEDLAVHRLSPEALARLREAGLEPGAVTVTARGVEITLRRVAA